MEYKKGRENKATDAFSRRLIGLDQLMDGDADELAVGTEGGCLFLISFPCPTWLAVLKDSYKEDEEHQKLITSSSPDDFSLRNGLFLYKDRVFLSSNSLLKKLVLQHVHYSPIGGHFGFLKTFYWVKQDFFWWGMKKDVRDHIRNCEICQSIKADTTKPRGLLEPLPIPLKPWFDIRMDFVDSLPKSHGFEVVLVVVDRLAKYVHFIPLSHPFTAAKVASVSMKEVFKLHGMPQTIVSDRDAVFTSNFWVELFRLQGTELAMSLA